MFLPSFCPFHFTLTWCHPLLLPKLLNISKVSALLGSVFLTPPGRINGFFFCVPSVYTSLIALWLYCACLFMMVETLSIYIPEVLNIDYELLCKCLLNAGCWTNVIDISVLPKNILVFSKEHKRSSNTCEFHDFTWSACTTLDAMWKRRGGWQRSELGWDVIKR